MKNLLLAFILAFSFLGFTLKNTEVYICNGKTIGKYHYSKSCRGLNACRYEIASMSLESAKSDGYTLCGWED